MHILLIHQAFASINEPGGTRHHEIARSFADLDHKVTIITGQVSYLTGEATTSDGWVHREVDEFGVEILRISSSRNWHRSFLHRLFSFLSFMISSLIVGLRIKGVDVVWGTTPPLFQGLSAWILARLKGAGFLFEIRDLWPEFAVAVGVLKNPLLIRLSEGLESFLYRRADRIVINSPGFRDHVTKRGGRSVDLIPNGVDVKMFSEGSEATLHMLGVETEGKFIVLYAGAHGEANDLNVVLEAASNLREVDEIHFVLIGDGKEKGSLIEKSEVMGLSNVEFLPPATKVEMPGILHSADVCLAILKPIEAFRSTYPNKVFDYMAAGKPVLLAIDGVIREVVEGAGAGIFVQPGDGVALADAVRKLRQNSPEVERMGRAGREHVSEFFNRSDQVNVLSGILQEMSS